MIYERERERASDGEKSDSVQYYNSKNVRRHLLTITWNITSKEIKTSMQKRYLVIINKYKILYQANYDTFFLILHTLQL